MFTYLVSTFLRSLCLLSQCVVAAFKRLETQKKIYKVDNQVGCVIAGLNADARKLSNFMKEECMQHFFTHEVHLPVSRLVIRVADRLPSSLRNAPMYHFLILVCYTGAQKRTLTAGRRPFGVGLLIAGVDVCASYLFI
jgi:20S proteasome subunit alpha 6